MMWNCIQRLAEIKICHVHSTTPVQKLSMGCSALLSIECLVFVFAFFVLKEYKVFSDWMRRDSDVIISTLSNHRCSKNGGSAMLVTPCGQCAEGKPPNMSRIWKIVANTVVAPTTTAISSFPSSNQVWYMRTSIVPSWINVTKQYSLYPEFSFKIWSYL